MMEQLALPGVLATDTVFNLFHPELMMDCQPVSLGRRRGSCLLSLNLLGMLTAVQM